MPIQKNVFITIVNFILFAMSAASAVASSKETNNLQSNNIQVYEQVVRPSNTKLNTPKTIDKSVIKLLERLHHKADNLKLIRDLSVSSEEFIAHTKSRLSENVTLDELNQLLLALSLINNQQAANTILEVGNKYINNEEFVFVFLRLLRDLKMKQEVDAFYTKLIEKYKGNQNMVRAILLNMAISKPPSLGRWATYYRSPGINEQVRFAGLYLSGTLIKDDMLERWLLKQLAGGDPPPPYQYYYLLTALSNQMDESMFREFLTHSPAADSIKQAVLRVMEFKQASDHDRLSHTDKMLNDVYIDQQYMALEWLLKTKGFTKTWRNIPQSKRVILVRLVYKLDLSIKDEHIEKNTLSPVAMYLLLCVLGIGLVIIIIFTKKLNKMS